MKKEILKRRKNFRRYYKICYLVAKDIAQRGSFALKTEHGPQLISLKREVEDKIGFERIQLITISRPSAYGEYEPYTFVDDADTFKQTVLSM